MRLICPKCDAQYEVDDSVIPDPGRDLECSNCGHSWYFRRVAEDEISASDGPAASSAPAGETLPDEAEAAKEPAPEVQADPDGDKLPADADSDDKAGPGDTSNAADDDGDDDDDDFEDDADDAPGPPPHVIAQGQPRELAQDVKDVLRQEADLEHEARKDEIRKDASLGIETQPDLGLTMAQQVTARRTAQARARVERLRRKEGSVASSAVPGEEDAATIAAKPVKPPTPHALDGRPGAVKTPSERLASDPSAFVAAKTAALASAAARQGDGPPTPPKATPTATRVTPVTPSATATPSAPPPQGGIVSPRRVSPEEGERTHRASRSGAASEAHRPESVEQTDRSLPVPRPTEPEPEETFEEAQQPRSRVGRWIFRIIFVAAVIAYGLYMLAPEVVAGFPPLRPYMEQYVDYVNGLRAQIEPTIARLLDQAQGWIAGLTGGGAVSGE